MVTVDDGVSGAREKAIKSSAAAEADLLSPSIEAMSIVTFEPPAPAA